MIEMLISIVVLFIVVCVLVCFEAPDIVVKVLVGLAVLVALLMVLDGMGIANTGLRWRRNL